ncbi:tetratricopeptide repeat protein [Caldinitratiruptor microaerophilus]|uniref:Tetratricopeptide repeat protein n=1 Tax=Caldinitratiruptor microaerophilus TaxID=671077 RepID=A0AA35G7T1_9FIRM|nr:tetratricopeptide repeat protein [Caldinitratiruptor microaerophilus]BDG60396.1 hypothetical protein caldi_14860 [Caldinitratiruptor microaerophilus]
MARAAGLLEKGQELLGRGDLAGAEARFRRAARLYPLPPAYNNWALCRYDSGDPAGTLRVLEPLLSDPAPLPFTRALASMAAWDLGRRDEARTRLRESIADLDRGLARPDQRPLAIPTSTWLEYTVMVLRAAGTLGEHRLVLELHARWPGRDMPDRGYYAGVALWNLGRHAQAARQWRRVDRLDWLERMEAYAQVAEMVDAGALPPFPLDYRPPVGPDTQVPKTPEEVERFSARGSVRLHLLAVALMEGYPDARAVVSGLVRWGGDWGLELGRRLLRASTLPLPLKIAAARALMDRGAVPPDRPLEVIHEGRPVTVRLQAFEVVPDDPALEKEYREAIRLRDAGETEAAIRRLRALMDTGRLYPPALLALAGLHRKRGDLDEAQSLLEILEQAYPDEPAVLLRLADLWLDRGYPETARAYVRRVDAKRLSEPLRTLHRYVLDRLREAGSALPVVPDVHVLGDVWREEIEDRPIPLDLTLARALRSVPVQWLNCTAAELGVEAVRRRREREQRVEAALRSPERLQALVEGIEPQAREALQFLLDAGGWAKVQVLTRRFGPMDGDGFWWDERPPVSVLGRLRARGLVYVGRARLPDGRRHRVAVVPVELRDLLAGPAGAQAAAARERASGEGRPEGPEGESS